MMLVQWPRLVTRSGSTHFDRSIVGSLDQITIEHTPHFMIEHDRAHRYSPPMQARGPGRLSVKSSCSSSCCTLRQAQLHEWTSMVAKTFQTGVHNLAKVGLAPARVFSSLPHRRLIYSRVCKVHVPPEHREQLETLCRLAPSVIWYDKLRYGFTVPLGACPKNSYQKGPCCPVVVNRYCS